VSNLRSRPEAGSDPPADRFKVVVEFYVKADCADDANEDIETIINHGIRIAKDKEFLESVYDFTITEAEPAEVP
jgi:hypothetical protein